MVGSADRQKVTTAIQESPGRQCRRCSNHGRSASAGRREWHAAACRPQSVLGRAAADDVVVSGRAIAVRLAPSVSDDLQQRYGDSRPPAGAPAADSAATAKVATS